MKTRHQSAFTLVELLVGMVVAVVVGLVLFALLQTATVLYATNVSINETHFAARRSIDRVLAKVEGAPAAPTLLDSNGATVAGNGPAAGLRCLVPASPLAYQVSADVASSATTLTAVVTGLPTPQIGDSILMTDLGFQGTVASVSGTGTTRTITLTSTAGSCFSPTKTGTVIPANSKFFLYNPITLIAVSNALRYYPRAKSVAADGSTAFNDGANFTKIAPLVPLTGATDSFPFQYLDASRRSVDTTLRINAPTYSNRVKTFNGFLTLRTTAAFRSSAIMQTRN